MDLSKEEQWQNEEWLRCRKDFQHFAHNYIKIQHPKRGLIPFDCYDFQKKVIADYEAHPMCIISKFRQGGLTTLTTLYMLWKCMFYTDQVVLVMSKTDREAIKAGKIVSKALLDIKVNHPWLYPDMGSNTHHEKSFLNTGSSIEFRTTKAARGQALTWVVIDEAAFIQGMEEAWKDMYPTVSTGGRVIVISTVNGRGNWYEEMYTGAKNGHNTFFPIDIDYTEHPDYKDPAWIERTKANMSPRDWAQEFGRSFLGSGNNFFGEKVLSEVEERVKYTPPIKKLFPEWESEKKGVFGHDDEIVVDDEWEKGALWIWHHPQDGQEYVLSVDAADGVGEDGDNSVFEVVNMTTLEQVAEFCSNSVPPHVFAMIISRIGIYYNTALVVVESNGPGAVVLDRLVHNLYYENLYYTQIRTQEKPGIVVNRTTRPVVLEAMQGYLQNGLVKINSTRLANEMNTFNFDRSKKRAEAQKGKHDDMVMAMAIALHIRDRNMREIPMGAAIPSNIADSHLSSVYDKIKTEIDNAAPEDLMAPMKPTYDLDDIVPGVIMPFERPYHKLLREFDW